MVLLCNTFNGKITAKKLKAGAWVASHTGDFCNHMGTLRQYVAKLTSPATVISTGFNNNNCKFFAIIKTATLPKGSKKAYKIIG